MTVPTVSVWKKAIMQSMEERSRTGELTIQQAVNRQMLWQTLMRNARSQFERAVDVNSKRYGTRLTKSQQRRRKRSAAKKG